MRLWKNLIIIVVKIDDALSGFVESHEARAMCSEKRLRADDDEGIQWEMFRVIMPAEDQAELAGWFYSYREYFKFGLTYLACDSSQNIKTKYNISLDILNILYRR